jgi:hypothetical protein
MRSGAEWEAEVETADGLRASPGFLVSCFIRLVVSCFAELPNGD